MDIETPQPTARDYLRVLRTQRRLIIVAGVVAALVALGISLTQTPEYSARTTVSVSDPSQDLGLLGTPTFAQGTRAELSAAQVDTVTRSGVLTRAKTALGTRSSITDLRSAITASVEPQSNLVAIEARASSADYAARLANEVARQSQAAAADRIRATYRKAADGLKASFRSLGASTQPEVRSLYVDRISRIESLARFASPVEIVSRAQAPTTPTSPKPIRNAVLGLILGLLIGVLLAYARNSLDSRVHDAVEIQKHLDLPLLGHVREEALGQVGYSSNGGGVLSELDIEAIRILRTNLDFLKSGGAVKSIAVTSGLPEEGKSTVAASLAFSHAIAGRRALLVECDLRRPSLAARFGIAPGPGIADYLGGNADPTEILQIVPTRTSDKQNGAPNLSDIAQAQDLVCITAGTLPSRPAEFLGSERFRAFIEQVTSVYDVVVLDTCPMLSVVDAREVLPLVDGVVLCVRAAQTTRTEVLAIRDALSHLPTRPTGLVVTGVRRGDEGDYGYYAYGPYASA